MSQTSSPDRWFEPFTGRRPAVFIATERVLPEADADENLLLEALAAAGVDPRLAAWMTRH
jgi:hypothetical protein